MTRRCPDCRRRKGRHARGCWQRCPVCSKGVLVRAVHRISEQSSRTYDCGHTWTTPDLIAGIDYRRRHTEAERTTQIEIARQILTTALAGADPRKGGVP